MRTVEVPRPPRTVRADARRRARDRTAARARAARSGRAPRPVAARGDAAGLGRFRRAGSARPVVAAVRRHVRAVDGRDAARRRRGREAQASGRRRWTRSGGTTCGTWRRRAGGSGRSSRSSGPAWSTCIPIPPPGPRCSRPAGCGNAGAPIPTSACCARAPARSGWPPRWSRRRPARWKGSSRSTALALRRFLRAHAVVPELPVALSLRGTAAIWLEAAPGAGPEPARALARGARRAVRAVARPGGRAARRGRAPPYLAPEWEWVKWLPHAAHPRLRDAVGPMRMITARADDVRQLVGGRARGPGPGHRSGGAAPARGRRRRGRPRLVGRGRGHDGAARGGATRPAADARRGAPARRAERAVVDGRGRRRRCRRQAGCLAGRRGHGVGPPARPVPARRCRPPGRSGVGRGPARAARPRAGCARPVTAEAVEALRVDRRRRSADRLCVPVGVDDAGAPVALDLKESAQGGSGPTACASAPRGRGRASCCGRWYWAWSPPTRRPS